MRVIIYSVKRIVIGKLKKRGVYSKFQAILIKYKATRYTRLVSQIALDALIGSSFTNPKH